MKITHFMYELSPEDSKEDEDAICRFPQIVQRIVPDLCCDISELDGQTVRDVLKSNEENEDFWDFHSTAVTHLLNRYYPEVHQHSTTCSMGRVRRPSRCDLRARSIYHLA